MNKYEKALEYLYNSLDDNRMYDLENGVGDVTKNVKLLQELVDKSKDKLETSLDTLFKYSIKYYEILEVMNNDIFLEVIDSKKILEDFIEKNK